jgi:hypothetical protein
MTSTSTTPDQYTWLDVDTVNEPFNGLAEIFINQWWATDRYGRICLYRNRSPFCHSDRDVAAMLLRVSQPLGATAITQLPVVFLPHRCEDR